MGNEPRYSSSKSGPSDSNIARIPSVGYLDKTLLGINASGGSVHKDNAA